MLHSFRISIKIENEGKLFGNEAVIDETQNCKCINTVLQLDLYIFTCLKRLEIYPPALSFHGMLNVCSLFFSDEVWWTWVLSHSAECRSNDET